MKIGLQKNKIYTHIMEKNRFDEVKSGVQEIIDFIAQKNAKEANNKLAEVSEELDELLDFAEEDEDLMEISRYQVLLNQLHQRIVGLNGQATESL
jgi:Zn-dependent M32 family carboxypeptidase